jgi:hypothetical protein
MRFVFPGRQSARRKHHALNSILRENGRLISPLRRCAQNKSGGVSHNPRRSLLRAELRELPKRLMSERSGILGLEVVAHDWQLLSRSCRVRGGGEHITQPSTVGHRFMSPISSTGPSSSSSDSFCAELPLLPGKANLHSIRLCANPGRWQLVRGPKFLRLYIHLNGRVL